MVEKYIRTAVRIDANTAPKLDAELKEILDSGNNHIVIDMEDTVYISSIGLRAFAAAQKRIRNSKGSMVIKNVKPKIMEIFEVTGFAGLFTIE
ncbi:MAG: STAS domain-containing protein [Clostridiales bacterium]|nr:STAS domain-containing protein [Clostridiales bacterium]